MSFQFMKCLFHIGSPADAKPHNDLSSIARVVKEHPDYGLVIVVGSKEEEAALGKAMESVEFPAFHPGALIVAWTEDSGLLDFICEQLHFVQLWRVVGPGWYECEKGHVVPATLGTPLEKCPSLFASTETPCGSPLAFVKLHEERVKAFCQILGQAINLSNFDTRSGQALNSAINPTGNVLRNMPKALGLPVAPALMLENFKGLGKGKRALSLASGPSLARAISEVKRLQETSFILSAGRNFKMLHAQGVRVDYVFSCEMFPWDSVIFDGVTREMAGDTILAYPPVCAPETLEKWPGRSLCTWDPNTAELLGRPLGMSGGNSIAHHMFNFAAEILECDPVILVGQDLGYTEPGETTHAPGTFHEFPAEIKREDTLFQAPDWGDCTSNTVGPFHPDCHQQPVFLERGAVPVGNVQVRTSPSYKCFGTLFEVLIKRHKRKVYNACPNGLKIRGAEYLDLATL